MPTVPFGEYLPDMPDFENPGSSYMLNVLPQSDQSYGPFPQLKVESGALAARCQGGLYVRDNASNVFGWAGDANKLYKYASGSTAWTDVTHLSATTKAITAITKANPGKVTAVAHGYITGNIVYITGVGGMTQVNGLRFTIIKVDNDNFTIGVDTTGYSNYTSGGTAQVEVGYSTSTDQFWDFVQFGQRIIATNYGDNIQTFLMGSDTAFSDLSATAPKARYCARVRDFLMVANTTDGVYGAVPQRVWWSAIDDPTSWPTPGSTTAAQVQSDFNDLFGDGGWNQGIVGGLAGCDVLVVQERALWRGTYIGAPVIFSFQVIENARGTPAPGSIVTAGEIAFYLRDDGFCETDGNTIVPIGFDKVDKTFWADVDANYLYRICSAADPLNRIVYWAYPGAGSVNGTPNKILAYHYALKRWTPIMTTTEFILSALSTGYTLDQLYTVLGYTFQTMPYPLDSRVWTGGRWNIGAFDTTHSFGFFSGTPLAATIDTSETNLNPAGGLGKSFVNRIWPLVDTSSAQATIGVRDRLADAVTWEPAGSMTATTGSVPIRATGVFHRGRVTIPAGTTWTHAQGIRFDARSAGNR